MKKNPPTRASVHAVSRPRWRFGAVYALVPCCLVACSAAPRHKPALTKSGINGERLPARTLILTYDDGPDDHTLELADYLDANDIHATFFVNGRRLCKSLDAERNCIAPTVSRRCGDGRSQAPIQHPRYYSESILDELIARGQRVANHSENHCNLLGEPSPDGVAFEIEATQAILERHVPDGVFLFRPPYGAWNAQTLAWAQTSRALDALTGPIFWEVDGGDWQCWRAGLSVEQCGMRYLQRLESRANRNGIVLMHDRPEYNVGYEGPVLLTKWLVPRLREAGYRFADMDDLLDGLPDEAASESP